MLLLCKMHSKYKSILKHYLNNKIYFNNFKKFYICLFDKDINIFNNFFNLLNLLILNKNKNKLYFIK
jgi:hypothetical protein